MAILETIWEQVTSLKFYSILVSLKVSQYLLMVGWNWGWLVEIQNLITAWKVSIFRGVLLSIFPYSGCIQFECREIRTRITPNTDTFYVMYHTCFVYLSLAPSEPQSNLSISRVIFVNFIIFLFNITNKKCCLVLKLGNCSLQNNGWQKNTCMELRTLFLVL